MNPQSGGAGFQASSNKSHSMLIIVLLVILLLAALGFGGWSFSGRQDYKNNVDAKIAVAVAAANKAEDAKQLAHYNEELKKPYKTYNGSPTYGSITFSYPLTYSAYVDTTYQSEPINGYFYPDVVPGVSSNTAFALRLELVSSTYSQVISQLTEQAQQGKVTAAAYIPPKMKGVGNVQPGTLFTGAIATDHQGNPQNGAELVIPVRDKTMQIYTLSTDYLNDFNNIVLPSLTFSP